MPASPVTDVASLVRVALGIDAGRSRSGEVATWSDDELLTALVDFEALGRQVEAWRMAAVVEVDERSGRGPDSLARRRGCRNSRELIRRVTGAAQSTVSRWLRLGRAIHEATGLTGQPIPALFSRVAAAVEQGRINTDAALSIVDNLNPVRPVAGDAAVAVAEDELVDACASAQPGGCPPIDADSVRIQAATWATFLDQDGAVPPEAQLAHRSLRLGGVHHGLIRVTGLLAPEVAAALRAFADACTNPRTPEVPDPSSAGASSAGANSAGTGSAGASSAGASDADAGGCDADTGNADAGDADLGNDGPLSIDDDGPADTRTSTQVLHDVLAMAINAAARVADQRSVAGNSPTVLVAVREADLAARRGTGAVFTGDTFGGKVPLSIDAARQLACSGAVQRVALNDAGAIVSMWSPERVFTGQQRRAIALRDGGCLIPGCHVPAGWCEVHHVTPHAEDPDGTHTSNGVLLCWYHHRTIETNGWQIRMHNAVPEVRPPAWLRTLTRNGPPGTDPRTPDDGWRRAIGSPTRILDALTTQHLTQTYPSPPNRSTG